MSSQQLFSEDCQSSLQNLSAKNLKQVKTCKKSENQVQKQAQNLGKNTKIKNIQNLGNRLVSKNFETHNQKIFQSVKKSEKNLFEKLLNFLLTFFPNLYSNIFLISILLVLICLAFYTKDSFLKNANSVFDSGDQTLQVRIIQKNSTNSGGFVFSERYLAIAKNKFIEIDNPLSQKILKIGHIYNLRGSFKFYNWDNSFDRYKITGGLLGSFKNKEILDYNCDFWCLGLQKISSWRQSIKFYYRQEICDKGQQIIDFLGIKNCQEIYALSVGLTLGGTEEFDKESKETFRNLGLSHLVAVSGFQVVLLFTFVENVLNRIKIARANRIGIIIMFLILMIMLVGPQPPVLRSSFSVLTSSFVLLLFGIKISSFRSLIYSAIWMLMLNPLFLFSVSFQLSFLASFGLILGFQQSGSKILIPKV